MPRGVACVEGGRALHDGHLHNRLTRAHSACLASRRALRRPRVGLDDPGGPGSNCDSWPGDLISSKDGSLFFVNGWGNIYRAPPGSLSFARLGNATIARPAPPGSFDDLHQIEFTFLPPAVAGGRWTMYHASYAGRSRNPGQRRADYGYKQAIGMYTFTWD